jgi:His/Glu/Gln/Arg/opine family amino acid ABC transporter permease subunit
MTDLAAWLPVLAKGFYLTLQLAAITSVFAFTIAAVVAVLSIAPSRLERAIASGYVQLFRSIPILALLIFLYYGLGPLASRLGISAFWIAVAALSVIEAAYLAEIFRAALQSVTAAQWDAGASLGLGWLSTLRLVVLPQAVPPALPGTTNMFITIIKDTSLASLVAVNEITLVATGLVGVTFRPIPVFALVACFYLALIIPLSLAAKRIEGVVAHAIGLELGHSAPSRSFVGRVAKLLGRRWM